MGLISLLFGSGSSSPAARRRSSAAGSFKLHAEDIVTLIEPAGGATVSDHIIVEGRPVGLMFRRSPRNSADTGWTFTSGQEAPGYFEENAHWKSCDLNTVANLDRTVIPYLSWPGGSRLERVPGTADFLPSAPLDSTTEANEQGWLDPNSQHGWHTVFVNGDDQSPGFGFTVGFYHSYDQPEIFVSGLSHEETHSLMRSVLASITIGRNFHSGDIAHDVANHPCAFIEVPRENYEEFLGYAVWYYRDSPFPVLQLVWPDAEGNFPWDPEYDVRLEQQVLGTRVI